MVLVEDALKKYVKKKIGKVPFSIIKLMWTMSKSSKESDNNKKEKRGKKKKSNFFIKEKAALRSAPPEAGYVMSISATVIRDLFGFTDFF